MNIAKFPVRKHYLLLDTFDDTHNPGEMNGTFANVGGNRTDVDTEGKMSQSGGQLVFAGGKAAPADGDPGRWYAAQTRVAGKTLLINVISVNNPCRAGFDTNQSGVLACDRWYFVAAGLRPSSEGVAISAVPTGRLALCLRTTGAFYFQQTSGMWLFLWAGGAHSDATLYPGISDYNGAFTASFIAIPEATYLPPPLLYSTFTQGDGALAAASEALGPDGQGAAVRAWLNSGNATVSGNRLVLTPATGGDLVTNGNMASDEPPGTAWTRGVATTIASGVATKIAGAAGNITQNILTAGIWYRATFDLVVWTAGSAFAKFGSALGPARNTTTATYTQTNRANGVTAGIVAGTDNDVYVLDNVIYVPITLASCLNLADIGTKDCYASAVMQAVPTGLQGGVWVRCNSQSSPTQCVTAYFDGAGNVKIEEMTAANAWSATLATVVKAFTAGDKLTLDVSGTAWRCYHTTAAGVSVLIGSGTTTVLTGTLAGSFATDASVLVETVEVFAKGTGNQYSILDSLGA